MCGPGQIYVREGGNYGSLLNHTVSMRLYIRLFNSLMSTYRKHTYTPNSGVQWVLSNLYSRPARLISVRDLP